MADGRTAAQPSLFTDTEPTDTVGGLCLVGDGLVEPHVADEPGALAVGAGRVAEAAEERRLAQAALAEANQKLRLAVASYRSEGATLRELGELMGVSAQAVHKDWLPASSRPRSQT